MTKARPLRDSYAQAASAGRAVLRTANSVEVTDGGRQRSLSKREHRVLNAVVAFTAMYSRLEARVYLAQLAAFTFGVEHAEPWMLKHTREALRVLDRAGLVVSRPPKGRPHTSTLGPMYVVALPQPADETLDDDDLPASAIPTTDPDPGVLYLETDPDPGVTSGEKCTPETARNAPQLRAEMHPRTGPPTEEYREDLRGESAALALALDLVEYHRNEVGAVLASIKTRHGTDETTAAVERLASAGAFFLYPSELRNAIEADIRRNERPAVEKPDYCGADGCEAGWVFQADGSVIACPTCPAAIRRTA